MPTILFRTVSSVFYIGGLVMTGIGGWYDYQQTLTMPQGPFGLSILLWGITLAGLGSLLLIAQMWYRIWTLENPKMELQVYPDSPVGMSIVLMVKNKTNVSGKVNAVMTCRFNYNELMQGVQQGGLRGVSMCWEAGKAGEDMLNKDLKILKLCSSRERTVNNKPLYYMDFYKVESGIEKAIACAGWQEGDAIPIVNVDIQLVSEKTLKGQTTWHFQVYYIQGNHMIGIHQLESRSKFFIRKIFGLNKFKERISE